MTSGEKDYITKKDVIDMPSALNNQVNLCDSCTYTYPECPSEKDDVIFGNGIGNDNICACNKYQPTVQPVATDTNVGNNSEIPNSSKGHWIFVHPLQEDDTGAYMCSECKVGNFEIDPERDFICPNCGADMRGEQNEVRTP